MVLSPETREATDEMETHFFVPFPIENEAQRVLDLMAPLPAPFRFLAETFFDRIGATIHATATPFLLANAAAHDQVYHHIHSAEGIRALNIDEMPGESTEALKRRRAEVADGIANGRMAEFSRSEKGIDVIVHRTAVFLLRLHKGPDIRVVAREVLLQGTVSTWATLEMLIKDGLTLLLNHRPQLVARITADPGAKKKFELPRLSVDDLASRDFDLSNQMGRLLFEERDLSSLPTLKTACEALIGSPALRETLASASIWRLNQARHLIVHRRGIVDEEFVRRTGSSLSVGDQLTTSPTEFEEHVRQALGIGDAFLSGLATTLADA